MDIKNFYFRQRVTQADLDEAFLAAENADKLITEDILGFGFLVSGPNPATVVERGVPDLLVLVNTLLGYDQQGRRISNSRSGFQGGTDQGLPAQGVDLSVDELGAVTSVVGGGNEKTISIFIEFRRKTTDPRLDGNGAAVFFLQDESIQFNVVQSAEAGVGLSVPPPLRGDQILLADITRIFGQTSFLNADIDQSRRQPFLFGLLHGGTHTETGADPVPNATGSVGGLLSAADKTRFDILPETAADIGALFNTQADLFQPANVTAPATTTLDVTGAMSGKGAGGSSIVEGVVTQTGVPNNRVIVTDGDFDDFVDGGNNKVYGRITVDNEGTPTAWTLSFFTNPDGVGETIFDMTPFAGTTIQWWVTETFLLQNRPTFDKFFSIPSDQVAAEYPFPIKAVDSGDSAIGGGSFSTIKEGSNITLADDGGGKVTISGPAAAAAVPVGTVVSWWRPTTSTAIPTDWEVCDGGLVSDAGSPFDGQTRPNLQDKFIRGLNNASLPTYGGPAAPPSGGADSHSHSGSVGSTGSAGGHSHNVNNHSHTISSDGGHFHHSTNSFDGNDPDIAGSVGTGHLTTTDGAHAHGGSTGSTGGSTDSQGSHSHTSGALSVNSSSNVPAYVGMLMIIKIK